MPLAGFPASLLDPALHLGFLLVDEIIDSVDRGVDLALWAGKYVATARSYQIGIFVGKGFQIVRHGDQRALVLAQCI